MDNHLESLLTRWRTHKDKCQWILATVIETQGSAYRKAGAMMLINDLGQYYGLVSGGCLESDVMRHAMQCLETGRNKVVAYDMQDDNDISWQLGIGCGGLVKILLQPITQNNQYLLLEECLANLAQGKACDYLIDTRSETPNNTIVENCDYAPSHIVKCHIKPRIRLGIFGAGVDAIPVVNMAKTLGWHVTLFDERTSYARQSTFGQADVIVKHPFADLDTLSAVPQLDVAIVMSHNITLDGLALRFIQQLSCSYSGLLGPNHRTEKVLKKANLSVDDIQVPLFTPIGFDIGGELPESLALSMLSQAHAFMYSKLDASQSYSKQMQKAQRDAS